MMHTDSPLLTPKQLVVQLGLPEKQTYNFVRVFEAIQGAYERQAKALRAAGEAVPAVMAVTIGAGQPHEATLRCGWVNVRGHEVMAVHEDDAAAVRIARDAMANNAKVQTRVMHKRALSEGSDKGYAR